MEIYALIDQLEPVGRAESFRPAGPVFLAAVPAFPRWALLLIADFRRAGNHGRTPCLIRSC